MYKLIRRKRNGRLYSASIGTYLPWEEEWETEYIPQKRIKPKTGKSFVFRRRKDAVDWWNIARFFHALELWRCKCTQVESITYGAFLWKRDFEAYWRKTLPLKEAMLVPEGTFLAGKVMLTERIL